MSIGYEYKPPRFAALPEGTTVIDAVRELAPGGAAGTRVLSEQLLTLSEDARDQERYGTGDPHVSRVLDWACQLRMGGLSWEDAISAASVFYYG